jgi:hypothetical protein
MTNTNDTLIACSDCFNDRGLHLDAEKIGIEDASPCPNCGSTLGRKLPQAALEHLAHRFFVWGSLVRYAYGAVPLIVFNKRQSTDFHVSPWLKEDVALIERLLDVGFFNYGPRLWMVGEVEPLKALQSLETRSPVVERILREYPARNVGSEELFYRIRKAPRRPSEPDEYDSPPLGLAGAGRLGTDSLPVLYASPDLQVCIHECRATAEDELYVATLKPDSQLQFIDLSVLLKEEQGVTEFESLDMAMHMLFLAGEHSYDITKSIATAAREAGFDGIVYPSYFSLLRLGVMPFQTVYGISQRRIPQLQQHEQSKSVPNIAVFGRPIQEGKVKVHCINRLILNQVGYDFHFGPAGIREET